jgi:aminobenzoyl-glutamate transport protein
MAGIAVLVVSAIIASTVVPENGVLRTADGQVAGSPFLKSIVAFIFVFFAIPGFVYGKVTGSMKNDRDVIDAMSKSMSSMGMYIVLVFFAAQFVAFFKWTNFGQVFAVAGADFLQTIGLTGPALFFAFILMCGFINLMIGSASAQWAVTAPIFVPMLMLVGYAPETIQAAYRIGDSTTNIITPMMSYFGLILAVATRYMKNLGIGTLIATMLPYSICFLVGWSLLFYIWVFLLGLPVGPGAATFYTP